ncbi:MAG: NfeD family protein [Coriobacteriia bacterium]|nr:NfeD family protein [Coriobacteriia bacterium]
MGPNIWLWVWVALAVILSIAEIATAGFFLLPFGIGAAVAAVLELCSPGSITAQWIAFIGVSSLLLVGTRRFAGIVTHEPPVKVAGDRLLGKTGIVIESIDPANNKGQVRVEREEWRAEAPGAGMVEVGTAVKVVSVEGTRLVVSVQGPA